MDNLTTALHDLRFVIAVIVRIQGVSSCRPLRSAEASASLRLDMLRWTFDRVFAASSNLFTSRVSVACAVV